LAAGSGGSDWLERLVQVEEIEGVLEQQFVLVKERVKRREEEGSGGQESSNNNNNNNKSES
jgi:hypothetical protein